MQYWTPKSKVVKADDLQGLAVWENGGCGLKRHKNNNNTNKSSKTKFISSKYRVPVSSTCYCGKTTFGYIIRVQKRIIYTHPGRTIKNTKTAINSIQNCFINILTVLSHAVT